MQKPDDFEALSRSEALARASALTAQQEASIRDALPAAAANALLGLDIYESPNGSDALQALDQIRALRAEGKKTGIILIQPGQLTDLLEQEAARYNADVRRPAGARECDFFYIERAVAKRQRRRERAKALADRARTPAPSAPCLETPAQPRAARKKLRGKQRRRILQQKTSQVAGTR